MYRTFINLGLFVLIGCTVSLAFIAGKELGETPHTPIQTIKDLLTADSNSSLNLSSSSKGDVGTSTVPPQEIFDSVLHYVHHEYVRNYFGNSNLSSGALQGMMLSLNNPYSKYLSPARLQAKTGQLNGQSQGIGAVLTTTSSTKNGVDYQYLTVMDVTEGGPAAKAGLKTGDHILFINGHWVIAYSILADVERIRDEKGKDDSQKQQELNPIAHRFEAGYTLTHSLNLLDVGEGKSYTITYQDPASKATKSVKLETAITALPNVQSETIDNGIMCIAIHQFNSETFNQVQQVIRSAPVSKGIILDLRGCSGGVTSPASANLDGYKSVCELLADLTPGGKAAVIKSHPNTSEPLVIKPLPQQPLAHIVVLTDHGTSNLAELLASGLHSCGKAPVVGCKTFGDNVLQLLVPLEDGSGVELATAHMDDANGKSLSLGVMPDDTLSPNVVDTNIAIEAAAKLL